MGRPRAVRGNTGDAVGLFFCGRVSQLCPNRECLSYRWTVSMTCHRLRFLTTSNVREPSAIAVDGPECLHWWGTVGGNVLEKSAENRKGEGPQRFFRSLASVGLPEGDQFSSQETIQLKCIVERSCFRLSACFFGCQDD